MAIFRLVQLIKALTFDSKVSAARGPQAFPPEKQQLSHVKVFVRISGSKMLHHSAGPVSGPGVCHGVVDAEARVKFETIDGPLRFLAIFCHMTLTWAGEHVTTLFWGPGVRVVGWWSRRRPSRRGSL